MKYLLIRHASTGMSDIARLSYGFEGPPISNVNDSKISKLHKQLVKLNIDLTNEPVAVSEMLRTKQTAIAAGLKTLNIHPTLNEIGTGNIDKTLQLMSEGKVPEEAINAANKIINNPPKERIWVTHGLLIVALQIVTNTSGPNHFEPDNCEITEIAL